MKIIMCIDKLIDEELEMAHKYAKKAATYQVEYPETSTLFAQLGQEEMGHVNRLHDAVVKLIASYRAKNGEPPKDMMEIYNDRHARQMHKAAKVKTALDSVR